MRRVLKQLRSILLWRCVIAELLASSLYCFFATQMLFRLSRTLDKNIIVVQTQSTALSLGFLVMVLSHGFGVSHNAFIFPSITFGKCLMKKTGFLSSLLYFLFQMIGGVIGVALDHVINSRQLNAGEIFPRLNVTIGIGCVIEGILSLLFVLAVLSTHEKESGRYQITPSLVFGFGVAASFVMGHHQTGAILNPSIVFGVGIVHNHWPQFVWIYWVGPLIGGMLGGLLYVFLLYPPTEKEEKNSRMESEKESSYSISSTKDKSRKLDHYERNAALSYIIESNSQSYKNPVFEDDTKKT